MKPHKGDSFWEPIYVFLGWLFTQSLRKEVWCREVFLKSHQLESVCKPRLVGWKEIQEYGLSKPQNFPWNRKTLLFFSIFPFSNHFLELEPWKSQSFIRGSEDYTAYGFDRLKNGTQCHNDTEHLNFLWLSENSRTLFAMWKLNKNSDLALVLPSIH